MASTSIFKMIFCGIALALCLPLLSSCDNSPEDIAHPFPKKIKTRIVLRPDSAQEDIRYVYMADDGITKTMTQIEYKNGVTSYTFHRDDGTAKETREYYPPEKGETQRQLKLHASFDLDGKNLLSRTTFRKDGSAEGQGERTTDGQFQTRWFFEDGATLNKLQVYDSERRLLSKVVYRKDGSVVSQSRRDGPSELVTKYYSHSGNLTHEFTEGRFSVLSGVFYNEDESIRIRFWDLTWKLNSQYFDHGDLKLEVDYYKDFMEVISYAQGKQIYKQVWTRIGNKGEECSANYKLFKVEGSWVLSPNSRTYTKSTIEMNDAGTAAQSVEIVTVINSSTAAGKPKHSRTRTVKILLDDGSVSFVKYYNEDILISERAGTDADRVDIRAFTSKPAFECLAIPTKAERSAAHSSFI